LRGEGGLAPKAWGDGLTPARPKTFNLFLALALVFSASRAARADDISALYQASWAGLPAAHIRLTLHDGPGEYCDEIAIGSEGLPRIVIKFRGIAVAEGKSRSAQPPAPIRYEANYDLRKSKNKQLRMVFTARDGAVIAERGPGDTSKKPPLAEQFRRNVVDPLSVVTLIRAAVRRGETAFTIPVYDGARRFDTIVKVLPRDPGTRGIRLALSLRAIAGFKGETSDDGDPDDAPRPVSLTLSDDARLLPLAMSVPVFFFPLDVTFERLCTSETSCAW
jgi:Protein of unknown function (DUF3108)